MSKKSSKIDFDYVSRESSLTKKDVGFLRIYNNFEEVIFTLEKDCNYTENIKFAIDQIKSVRGLTLTHFVENSVCNG